MHPKLNSKGFTMVELLAVFAILAILALIAIPVVSNLTKQTTAQYYKTLEDNMKVAGMEYYSDYRSERPLTNYATSQISLENLVGKNYIEKVVDSKGDDTCSGTVRIFKKKEGEYEYKSCLVCSDYRTTSEICENDYDPDNNSNIYTIEAPSQVYSYVDKIIDITKLEKAKLKARDTVVGSVPAFISSIEDIDVSQVGVYPGKVEYIYEVEGNELKTSSDLVIYQNPAPNVNMVNCSDDSHCNNGNYLSGAWTKYNVKETITSPSYVRGTLDRFQIYDNKSYDWIDLCSATSCDRYTSASVGKTLSLTNLVRSLDQEGNPSAVAEYQINIDKIDPQCTLRVASGTIGENSWYKSDVVLEFGTKTDTHSNLNQFGISLSTTPSYGNVTYTYNTEGEKTVYGHVQDTAGNEAACQYSVKKDSKAPTISTFTAKSTNTTYSTLNVSLTINASDETSGVSQIYLSNTGYETGGSWEKYVTSKNWTVSGSYDGVARTIYLAVKDNAGNISHKTVTYTPYKVCTTTTTTWSGSWSSCSVTCGTGTQTMSGTKKDSYTGASCGTTSKSQSCTMPSCSHTHVYGVRYNSTSATYPNYRKSTYHWNGTWTCTAGHTHKASTTLTAYKRQCIYCGKTEGELTGHEVYWCPCDVPGLGCQYA